MVNRCRSIASFELREFKVMEDAEDGLDDLHGFGGRWAVVSLARAGAALADPNSPSNGRVDHES